MRRGTGVGLAVAAIVSTLHAGAARADDRGDAESLFRIGSAAFDAARYADAAGAFEQAYAKLPLPAIAFSLAQAQRLQYFIDNQPARLQRAVELYHAYIEQQKAGGRIADAAANLGTIEPLLRQLQASGVAIGGGAQARVTQLVVSSDVASARATIDGVSGAVPFMRDVSAGEHDIAIEADGYAPYRGKALAVDGQMRPVEHALVALPATLLVDAPASAHLAIDGRDAGEAWRGKLELPAGPHLVVLSERGHVAIARDLVLTRGASTRLDGKLATTRQRKIARVVWIAGGAATVATGIAVGFALHADSEATSDLAKITAGNASTDTESRYATHRTERDHDVTTSEAFGGVALAALVTGAALYWFDDRAPEIPRKLEIAPSASPTGRRGDRPREVLTADQARPFAWRGHTPGL